MDQLVVLFVELGQVQLMTEREQEGVSDRVRCVWECGGSANGHRCLFVYLFVCSFVC